MVLKVGFLRPKVAALHVDLLEMCILGSHLRLAKSETLALRLSKLCFNKFSPSEWLLLLPQAPGDRTSGKILEPVTFLFHKSDFSDDE